MEPEATKYPNFSKIFSKERLEQKTRKSSNNRSKRIQNAQPVPYDLQIYVEKHRPVNTIVTFQHTANFCLNPVVIT